MNLRLPLTAFLLTQAALAAALVVSARSLPPVVASHFNAQGLADGWTSRSAYLLIMGALGPGLGLALACLFYAVRLLPDSAINLPRREYWLAPERRAETCAGVFHSGLWFVSLLAVFQTGVQLLIISANKLQPPQLPSQFSLLLGSFAFGVVVWVYSLHRRFNRIPLDKPAPL